MTCVHLRKLYDLCQENNIRLASTDLVHVVCTECGRKEVCPSVLMDEYEWDHPGTETEGGKDAESSPPVEQSR